MHQYHDHGKNTDGTRWTRLYAGHTSTGSVENSPRWTETTTNPLGQVIEEERPGYNGSSVVTTHAYNALGRRVKTSVEDDQSNALMADTLYEYDAMGNIFRTGLNLADDLNEPDELDTGGTDRITETDTVYKQISTDWWIETTNKIYTTDNASTTVTISIDRDRLTGFGTNEIAESESEDGNGRKTVVSVTIGANKSQTTTIDHPDATNDEVRVVENGLMVSHTSKTGVEMTYGHDELGRQATVTDPRTGTRETSYNSLGQVEWTEDEAGHQTGYTYDADTGRLKTVTDPLSNVTRYAYNDRGDTTNVWGSAAIPVAYTFDGFGQRVTMSTFQGGSNWNSATWPTGTTGTADVTVWVIEPATGLLLEKRHADYDSGAGGPKWVYTYTVDGRLATRTWAREDASSNAIVTTYGYDADTGEMTSVTYTDDTPDVAFTYDRAGRRETIEDVVGTRTFTYRADDMQLATESIDGSSGGLYTKMITRDYASSGDAIGRTTGFRVGTTGTPNADIEVDYAYDTTTGRLKGVTGPGLSSNGVTYTWHDDSDLVKETLFKNDAGTTVASAYRQYEEKRDLIDHVENKAESALATIAKYDYKNDAMGRRTAVETSGTAFSSTTEFNQWLYNFRSELTSSKRYAGAYTATPNSGDEITAERRLFTYDNIGNREESTEATTTRSYTANNVNQYTDLTNPAESFDHDKDGNLKQDGTFTYTWDAENRLVAVQTRVDLGNDDENPDAGDKLIEFKYDYMNRRVEKRYRVYTSGDWADQTNGWIRFVYDQWNVVLVLDASDNNATLRKYTWGLDLSGQNGNASASGVHGAGGIGGLLAVEETATSGSPSYWFFYDANGNVGQIVNNASGYAVAAHYEYDPYGNVITSDGAYAADNPIRFSTKWFDAETGLGYWGYRYYSPKLGRWMNRDPIGEMGGINLLAYVSNLPFNVDMLGLCCDYDCNNIKRVCDTRVIPGKTTDHGCRTISVPRCNIWDDYSSDCCDSGWKVCCLTTTEVTEIAKVCSYRVCTPKEESEDCPVIETEIKGGAEYFQRKRTYHHESCRCVDYPIV